MKTYNYVKIQCPQRLCQDQMPNVKISKCMSHKLLRPQTNPDEKQYKNTTKQNTETTQPIIKWMMSQITATTTNSQTIPVGANHCTD